jgi:glycosyltransferase involved in cell wall biosynthesis
MAISYQRLESLRLLRESQAKIGGTRAVFSGSLYEPRTTILNEIRDNVRERGRELEILARPHAGERVSNEEYWSRLSQADIIVTTADQIAGPGIDDLGMPHLIFRYSEALAAGALLIAPTVPGIERYFIPGRHFVSFDSIEDVAEKICFYLENEDERLKISRAGNERISNLISTYAYWVAIDVALGTDSMVT